MPFLYIFQNGEKFGAENDMWEERSKHIESCSGADTYQAHMIYNTHNVVYDK